VNLPTQNSYNVVLLEFLAYSLNLRQKLNESEEGGLSDSNAI
jgi:hypothetical protein